MENWEIKQEENIWKTPEDAVLYPVQWRKFRSRIKHISMYFSMEIHGNKPSSVKLKAQAIQSLWEIKKKKMKR